MLENFIVIVLLNWLAVTILWLYSLKSKKADIIDTYWGLGFFIICIFLFYSENNFFLINYIIIALVGIWSFRLAFYLHIRNHNKPEDDRYVKLRKKWGGNFGLYLVVYLSQALLISIISLPLQMLLSLTQSVDLNYIAYIGIVICLGGIVIESLADIQLTNFKSNTDNQGIVMNKGLWKYSRHPNYFGDSLFWWGVFIISFSVTNNFFMIISPIIMTYLLIKVSGVALLEHQIKNKKIGYDEYIKSTSSFIILPKRRNN